MKDITPTQTILEASPRLMLFDLALGGHHGNYIQYLVDYAHTAEFSGVIDIVVLPQFLEIHKDTVAAIDNHASSMVNWAPISREESSALVSRDSGINRTLRNFQEWQVYCRYARVLKTTQALIMYLDTCELPLAVGKCSPCSFSGIYFRPTFHYPSFTNFSASKKDQLQRWREKITLNRILRSPQLKTIFCLDPYAVNALKSNRYSTKMVHLADPVSVFPDESSSHTHMQLGIEKHRTVFLLFGALDGRKGIYQLLDAIQELSSDLCQDFCLLLVGKASHAEQDQIHQRAAALCQSRPIQLIECYDFVPDDDVPSYFHLADVVLAPYQRHVGMSGILLLAAAAGKPVLSSDYGLMGEVVRQYKLGLVLDSSLPTEIAQGITRCLREPLERLCDRIQMKKFAEQNSVDCYTSTIFHNLYPDLSQTHL